MSKIEYDPDTYDRLFNELSARLIEEDTGTVVTALTVLLGNAGYWHSMDFDQFMDYVERNMYLVYVDQRKEDEQLSIVH